MHQDVTERALALADNVEVTVFDVADLRAEYRGDWAALDKAHRRRLVEQAAPIHPAESGSSHNVTCIAWHEYIAKLLNFKHDYEEIADPAAEIAFGDDATSGFAVGDQELNNRVGAIALTDPANEGDTWTCSEYLSSVELNGETLREGGIISESGDLRNHFEMPTYIDKDSNTAVLVEIYVPFGDQTEV